YTTSSHHTRRKTRLVARRLDVLFQEAMRFLADIAGTRVGPGAAFVVGGAGRPAGLVALLALDLEALVVAADPIDRTLDAPPDTHDHAGAAHAGDAAIVLHPRRHRVLEPAQRADRGIGRIVEAPGVALAVALAHQCAVGRIARGDGRRRIIASGAVEIRLRARRARDQDGHDTDERRPTCPMQTAIPHTLPLSAFETGYLV